MKGVDLSFVKEHENCPVCGEPAVKLVVEKEKRGSSEKLWGAMITFKCNCVFAFQSDGTFGPEKNCPRAMEMFLRMKHEEREKQKETKEMLS